MPPFLGRGGRVVQGWAKNNENLSSSSCFSCFMPFMLFMLFVLSETCVNVRTPMVCWVSNFFEKCRANLNSKSDFQAVTTTTKTMPVPTDSVCREQFQSFIAASETFQSWIQTSKPVILARWPSREAFELEQIKRINVIRPVFVEYYRAKHRRDNVSDVVNNHINRLKDQLYGRVEVGPQLL